MNDVLRCLILFVAIGEVLAAFAAEPPLMMIRLRGPHTADDAQWAKTFKALKENRAACDEVWFSTGIGFPKMEWHEAHVSRLKGYAEQLRAVGIVPSLQFQATFGHSDDTTLIEGADGKAWGGFMGRAILSLTCFPLFPFFASGCCFEEQDLLSYATN